ncbi:cbb3-type cytochrome oxidase assembly protein CcoS [Bremerella cremea]|uniref:Cbb3-type cytochrome oxidase assembly protein CcoS n=1 Tax=Bremerella cremea TaxID=1031537 RepID=A0A368KSZ6_9BACT|nr:cbb3-type cytochrome oxidase assembly protein CcoS [Bremerella cremea]RCS48253.1 cbb3-type cytochrome oxidase assembly protein CcoS [Bremerella cremea]
MSVIYIALPIALFLAGMAVAAFVWCTKQGQFDDLETPAVRILQEDRAIRKKDS